MGIFSAATPFDQVVDRATSEKQHSDDWSQIMDICDKVKESTVSERLRQSLKKWAEGDFKGDPQLSLIPALYAKLKQEGYDFNVHSESQGHTAVTPGQRDHQDPPRLPVLVPASLHRPLFLGLGCPLRRCGSLGRKGDSEGRRHDFEAVEDNELTFKAGEIGMEGGKRVSFSENVQVTEVEEAGREEAKTPHRSPERSTKR
ncbi:Signal transducing adapter molecule 1-like [Homarus americanus]|uniref:Signal transducing adapter molecule 1-like n=1 Tax=Homarus americanus TaxID=6706 RepID=A0A8J5JAP2_HOMAM|nr:Signal transducing adapter molecule 1-like [Homarus americanus]